LIFPEGTRTRPGEQMTLQRGAANIAVRCASDLRVVTIRCSEHMLGKQCKWYDAPPTKPLFTIEVRERIRINQFFDASSQTPSLAARQLNRHLLLQLQSGTTPTSGINDASALS
jgi:1-acyl-sn-glycerol-3-phosphate acyltransferase